MKFADPDVKKTVRCILECMHTLELEKYGYDRNGEDGDKTYSFNRLLVDQFGFTKALKKGNPEEIIQKYKACRNTYDNMKSMIDEAGLCITDQPGKPPVNFDTIRNHAILPELSVDHMAASKVNALFLAYIQLVNSGMPFDQALNHYLENPNGTMLQSALNQSKPYAFETLSKGLSMEDSIELMAGSGKFADAESKLSEAFAAFCNTHTTPTAAATSSIFQSMLNGR